MSLRSRIALIATLLVLAAIVVNTLLQTYAARNAVLQQARDGGQATHSRQVQIQQNQVGVVLPFANARASDPARIRAQLTAVWTSSSSNLVALTATERRDAALATTADFC